jgi:hypothetical protein
MKFVFASLFVFFSSYSWPCKCADTTEISIEERAIGSHKSYIGKIVNAKVLGDGSKSSAALKVIETFKGDVFDVEEIVTNNTSCGVMLVLNATYIVFEDNTGHVNMCTMTIESGWRSFYTPQEIEQLRTFVKPNT